jgi:hypothetical protein
VTSLAVPKQAGLYFQPIDWRGQNLAPANFSIVRTEISIFVKIIPKSPRQASNSIDMNPFLLRIIRLSSDYDAVHFGGDLGCEEDENIWNGSPKILAQI